MTPGISNELGALSALERFGSSPTAIIKLNEDKKTFRVITNPNALQRLCHWLCQKFSFKTATSGANKTLIGRTLIQLLQVPHDGSLTQFSDIRDKPNDFKINVRRAFDRLDNEGYPLEATTLHHEIQTFRNESDPAPSELMEPLYNEPLYHELKVKPSLEASCELTQSSGVTLKITLAIQWVNENRGPGKFFAYLNGGRIIENLKDGSVLPEEIELYAKK